MAILTKKPEQAEELSAEGNSKLLFERLNTILDNVDLKHIAKQDLLKVITTFTNDPKVELSDFILAIRSFGNHVRSRSGYAVSLDNDIFIAESCANTNGKVGSQPGKPHLMIPGEAARQLSRRNSVLKIQDMQIKLYQSCYEFLNPSLNIVDALANKQNLDAITADKAPKWDKLVVDFC